MRALIVILIIVLIAEIASFNQHSIKASDSYLRARVVKLVGEAGSCSGVEVKSPKGVVYTLTAGHCRVLLAADNTMTAIDEEGHKVIVTLVKENTRSDLLLLSSNGDKSAFIGESVSAHERVKAITHGHGLAAFRTDGELVQEEIVTFAEEVISTPAELASCIARSPKTIVYNDQNPFTGETNTLCLVETKEMIATTLILPGSSGGPLFNLKGQVVGIASAGTSEDPFGRFVRLSDIQAFMKDM